MAGTAALNRLLESERWNDFFKSVAAGLQVCLTLIVDNTIDRKHTCEFCPDCKAGYADLTQEDVKVISHILKNDPPEQEFVTSKGAHGVLFRLDNNIYIAATECAFLPEPGYPDIKQRAGSAQKLLSCFLSTLGREIACGEKAVELSTLRQMNHIVLAMFHGSEKTLEYALDLILSALIIMLDAKGSWLEYKSGSETHLLIKGDRELVEEYLHQECSQSVAVEVKSSMVQGKLAVLFPEDMGKASSLMPSMAQECLIVFEIDHLLKLMKSQLSRVLGSISSTVVLFDNSGIVCYANNAAYRLLAVDSAGLIGLRADMINSPWAAVVGKTRGCTKGSMDKIISGSNEKLVDWQVCPIIENGETEGWLVTADDRTDYYRWLEAGKKAERMAAAVSMIGTLSNELRNPISTARSLVQLMGQIKDPHKIVGYTDMVLREIDRVTCFLNEFLLLGAPCQIPSEFLDLASLLNNLAPILSGEASGTGVEIVTNIETVPPILADSGQLTHVILNLTRNGIDAAGPNGCVDISIKHNGNWIELSVKDSGPGIKEEAMDKLFEPFFTTKEHRAGLGLSIVQAIVNNHGGRVTASNATEGGGVFTVFLPSKRVVQCNQNSLDVMIVVSDDIIRNSMDQVLHIDWVHTYSTRDLSNAFSAADVYYPNVLILDKSFVKKDSLDYINRIWPETKLLILGKAGEEKGLEHLNFISLPLDYSKLIEEIRSMLK